MRRATGDDVQLTLPEELADELLAAGVVEPNRLIESKDFGAAVPVIIAIAGVAGHVVTLVKRGAETIEALRTIANAITGWRRRKETPEGFTLMVRRRGRTAKIELSQDPDPDALFDFLRSSLYDE